VWNALWVAQIGNHKPGHVRQRRDGFGNVPVRRLFKVEEDRQIVPLAKLVSDGVEYGLALGREAAKDEDDFGRDRVDDVADLFVVQEQTDELSNFQTVGCNAGLVRR
jgi:hypothetical protein